ncbi:hypothetical protein QA648_36565 (plasmid) [Rhizobium sp. CB3171]|uniref:hypothetical protein n=1 Tax=Rhizobium sp. CB3171 TaxID=3039157 RepID=UPI0024B08E8C|nr:hypothetical protein [Rhizobium sp. CB3171]WFU07445.1 hypothetical protein QA648_36565 [Rhizobium sp. CB3171]
MRAYTLIAATAFLSIPTSVLACDDKALGDALAAKWKPKIEQQAGSICGSAKVMIDFLKDSKKAMAACLHGKSLNDADSALDASIQQWQQTKNDACSG